MIPLLELFCLFLAFPCYSFPSHRQVVFETDRYTVYTATFPSSLQNWFSENNTVWLRLYLPRPGTGTLGASGSRAGTRSSAKGAAGRGKIPAVPGGPRHPSGAPPRTAGEGKIPAVLVLPVTAAPNAWIEERFCIRLARDGFAAALLELPYQFHRAPRGTRSGAVFLARRPEQLARNFLQGVLDAGLACRWLKSQPEIGGPVGVLGISLGAFVGEVALGMESCFEAGAYLLGGGRVAELMFESALTREAAFSSGYRPEDLEKIWRDLEPLSYREVLQKKHVLLVNALWDRVVPRRNAEALHRGLPQAKKLWVPLGHYSSAAHLIWLPGYVSRYFREVLK